MKNDGKVRMTTLDLVCNTRHRQLSDDKITVVDRPNPDSQLFHSASKLNEHFSLLNDSAFHSMCITHYGS
jgi:hypothetical protein